MFFLPCFLLPPRAATAASFTWKTHSSVGAATPSLTSLTPVRGSLLGAVGHFGQRRLNCSHQSAYTYSSEVVTKHGRKGPPDLTLPPPALSLFPPHKKSRGKERKSPGIFCLRYKYRLLRLRKTPTSRFLSFSHDPRKIRAAFGGWQRHMCGGGSPIGLLDGGGGGDACAMHVGGDHVGVR